MDEEEKKRIVNEERRRDREIIRRLIEEIAGAGQGCRGGGIHKKTMDSRRGYYV